MTPSTACGRKFAGTPLERVTKIYKRQIVKTFCICLSKKSKLCKILYNKKEVGPVSEMHLGQKGTRFTEHWAAFAEDQLASYFLEWITADHFDDSPQASHNSRFTNVYKCTADILLGDREKSKTVHSTKVQPSYIDLG